MSTVTMDTWTRRSNTLKFINFKIDDINYAVENGFKAERIFPAPVLLLPGSCVYEVKSTITAGDGVWFIEALIDPNKAANNNAWNSELRLWTHSGTGFTTASGGIGLGAASGFPTAVGVSEQVILAAYGHQGSTYTNSAMASGLPIWGLRWRYAGTTASGIADIFATFGILGD